MISMQCNARNFLAKYSSIPSVKWTCRGQDLQTQFHNVWVPAALDGSTQTVWNCRAIAAYADKLASMEGIKILYSFYPTGVLFGLVALGYCSKF